MNFQNSGHPDRKSRILISVQEQGGNVAEIEVTIDTPPNEIHARDFQYVLERTIDLIQSLSPEELPLHILDMRMGCAIVTVEAPQSVSATLSSGINALRSDPASPVGWTNKSLHSLAELAGATSREKITGITFKIDAAVQDIDATLGSHAQQALTKHPKSIGSVTGRLYRYNNNKQATAGLCQTFTQSLINIQLTQELAPVARELLEENVTVWGILTRDTNSNEVLSVVARGLEPVPSVASSSVMVVGDGPLPADWTDGKDSVTWVREIRKNWRT